MCSGLAKRAKFVMSHDTGKIEILGTDTDNLYFRYHRSVDGKDRTGELISLPRDPCRRWIDAEELIAPPVKEFLPPLTRRRRYA